MYDLIIVGAGPAGVGAGIRAAEKKLNTLVLTKAVYETNSQTAEGFFKMREAVDRFNLLAKNKQLEVKTKTEVIKLEKNIVSFCLEEKNGKVSYAKSVIIACGNSDLSFDSITQKSANGKIKADYTLKTSVPGIWAAGECVEESLEDYSVAFLEGIKAAAGVFNSRK